MLLKVDAIKSRCYNSNDIIYHYYGGKGIIMCNEWLNDFNTFFNWAINNNYYDNTSIDRINNDGNYEPSNCRWVVQKKQNNNKSNNVYIEINNETETLMHWCEVYDMDYSTALNRIRVLHWDPLKALTTPIRQRGSSKNRLYIIWHSLKRRCYNKSCHGYNYYGGKGITICDEWRNNYAAFEEWSLANGYQDDLSIGRINSNGNYAPSNCRWTTMKEQNNNKSNNVYIEINNETKTLMQWCEQYKMDYKLVYTRIKILHWDPLKALTTPVK